jgi:hypothetical protein
MCLPVLDVQYYTVALGISLKNKMKGVNSTYRADVSLVAVQTTTVLTYSGSYQALPVDMPVTWSLIPRDFTSDADFDVRLTFGVIAGLEDG